MTSQNWDLKSKLSWKHKNNKSTKKFKHKKHYDIKSWKFDLQFEIDILSHKYKIKVESMR